MGAGSMSPRPSQKALVVACMDFVLIAFTADGR
jgi:hypothetical protein